MSGRDALHTPSMGRFAGMSWSGNPPKTAPARAQRSKSRKRPGSSKSGSRSRSPLGTDRRCNFTSSKRRVRSSHGSRQRRRDHVAMLSAATARVMGGVRCSRCGVYMAPNTTRGNVKEVASSFCDECFSILVQKRMVGGRGPPKEFGREVKWPKLYREREAKLKCLMLT